MSCCSQDLENPSISPKERVLLAFTAKVTEESYKVSASDIQSLQNLDWQQQQIAEAVHIASLFACFNRVANAFGLSSQNLFSPTLSQLHTKDQA
jgi:alkylhydroperoxidase family enzyme